MGDEISLIDDMTATVIHVF